VIDTDIVVSQTTLDFMKVENRSDNEMFLPSYRDKLIDGKVEDDSHKEEEDDPLLRTLPEVKSEYEVCTEY
jgi:hypothetical protein